MAGDWIKMRACLSYDPKVIAIGKHLASSPRFSRWISCGQYEDIVVSDVTLRYVVTGALHNVWCNANEHCVDDLLPNADLSWVDAVSGIDDFGAAMQSVGWIEVLDNGIRFPKFNSHNTSAAERQKRYRERKALQCDVTRDVTPLRNVTSKRREEKRRHQQPPTPFTESAVADVVKMLRAEPYGLRYAAKAVDEATYHGVQPSEVVAIAHFWRDAGTNGNGKPAPWDRCDLFERIRVSMPGEQPDKHWPPAGSWQTRKAK